MCQGTPSIESVTREFFQRVDAANPDAIVLDVRLNRGGNVAMNDAFVKAIESRAAFRAAGRLYVITGRSRFSAGTEMVRSLKRMAAPIIVGEPSRGDPRIFVNREEITLPSSGFRVDYAQTRQRRDMDAVAHIPVDLPATPTFEAYATGRDLAIEAILACMAKAGRGGAAHH